MNSVSGYKPNMRISLHKRCVVEANPDANDDIDQCEEIQDATT